MSKGFVTDLHFYLVVAIVLGFMGFLFATSPLTLGTGNVNVLSVDKGCTTNKTSKYLDCTKDYISGLQKMVTVSSDNQLVQAIILGPLSMLGIYVVLTRLVIPIVSAVIPG